MTGMKVTVAIDSFKGSLTTFEAGAAISEGITEVFPDAVIDICPIADGGEGTLEAIVRGSEGMIHEAEVTGPLGEKIKANYGILPDNTAVIEMSRAAGITLIEESRKNPLYTTTYGVGELIADAIKVHGCRNFIIGIGGSATNDGGVGMLSALGFKFYDANGCVIPFGAQGLSRLSTISTAGAMPELSECTFRVACDVTNPLCGKLGCSAIYGPQKGATPDMIADMDQWLSNYARLTSQIIKGADPDFPGSGAAGGLGYAFRAYLKATLESGITLVMNAVHLDRRISDADIVITGEGRLDAQTCMGKAPIGVAARAKKAGKTVIAFSGCVVEGAGECNSHGIDAYFPIVQAPCSLEEAMEHDIAYRNLKNTAEQVFRLIRSQKNQKIY